MSQTQEKRSYTWLWIILIALVVFCFCCATAAAAFFVLQPDESSWREEILEQLETPDSGAVVTEVIEVTPFATTPTPVEVDYDPIIIAVEDGIWAVDASSYEFRDLYNAPLDAPYQMEKGLSPDRNHFAYITGFGGASTNPILVVLELGGEWSTLQLELTGPVSQPGIQDMPGDPAFEATRAMTYPGSLAWSPDSTQLAFIGAMDGESADVYTLNLVSGEVQRASDEPNHAAALTWSPDGRNIVYTTVTSFGTGAGLGMDGIWVVDITDMDSRRLADSETGGEEFLGWLDNDTLMLNSWGAACERYHLRTLDISSGSSDSIMEGCFSGAAFAPEADTGLLTVNEFNQDFCDCGTPISAGLYTFNAGSISDLNQEPGTTVDYLPTGEIFMVFGPGIRLYDTDGNPINLPDEVERLTPIPTSSEGYWAWIGHVTSSQTHGLWITQRNQDPRQITEGFVNEVVWSRDGETVFYIQDGSLYAAGAPLFDSEFVLDIPEPVDLAH